MANDDKVRGARPTVDVPAPVVAEVVARAVELAAIPAPPLQEGARTARVAQWWKERFAPTRVDRVGNVWAPVRPGSGPAVVVAAHLDTVFPTEVEHRVVRHGTRLTGPSIGDDSVAVAALAALDELLPAPMEAPVWLLATVGEEGLGDLLGIRTALDEPVAPVAAVIALEGTWLGRVCTVGVGSVRYRVTLRGPGGHAWEAAATESAVHVAGRVVASIAELDSARPPGTAVNVGTIQGGTAINARASTASFELDLRATSPDALRALDQAARATWTSIPPALQRHVVDVGRRPAGSIPPDHRLVAGAVEALREVGITASITAGSTDANAAHERGIPAIAVGVTVGGGEHTLDEWIETEPIAAGLRALATTVVAAAGIAAERR